MRKGRVDKYPRGMFRLELSRSQILGFRRRVGSLDERLPVGTKSLRRAAWAGLHDSMPRAAVKFMPELRAQARQVGRILTEDETAFRTQFEPAALARLLPSGDAYYLMWELTERSVPDAERLAALWTTRVWPGALLVNGESSVSGRSAGEVSIEAWRRLSSAEREAVEAEALSLPLPGLNRPIASAGADFLRIGTNTSFGRGC
jgi:hypothetical protein